MDKKFKLFDVVKINNSNSSSKLFHDQTGVVTDYEKKNHTYKVEFSSRVRVTPHSTSTVVETGHYFDPDEIDLYEGL